MVNNSKKNIGNNTLVLILGFAGFVSAADNWFVSPAIAAIASDLNISVSLAGIILTLYMIPYGFMQPFYGFFADRWSKYGVIRFIICGLAIGTMGCSLSKSLLWLCIFRVVTGFFAAGIIAVSLAIIGDTIKIEERQEYVGKFMGIVFLGQGLSAGLGGLITEKISWHGAFLFFSLAAIISAILIFKKLPSSNKRTSVDSDNLFRAAKLAICTSKGRIIFPLALLAGFLLLGVYSYLGSFMNEVMGLNYLQCGLIIMFYGFACLIGGRKVGSIARKIGTKNVIILGCIFALLTTLMLYLIHYWVITIVATILLGFGYICIQSTLATLAFDFTENNKGLSSGLIGLGLFGGGGLGSYFSGFLLSKGSYDAIWITFSIMLVIFILIIFKINFKKL